MFFATGQLALEVIYLGYILALFYDLLLTLLFCHSVQIGMVFFKVWSLFVMGISKVECCDLNTKLNYSIFWKRNKCDCESKYDYIFQNATWYGRSNQPAHQWHHHLPKIVFNGYVWNTVEPWEWNLSLQTSVVKDHPIW